MMVELLVAMFVLTVALTALVAVFTTGILTMRKASQVTTATFLADAQLETYRAMTSMDIGIDVSAGTVAALDSTYTNDAACANASISKTCAANGVGSTETGPTGVTPDTCTTINTWYSSTSPCTPSRTITSASSPASPDGRSYRIDTYITQLAATGTQRAQKQVTVVVRDGVTVSKIFVRDSSTFDCSTGVNPSSADC
jgi:type II secretory pathway pseudopilin PulG